MPSISVRVRAYSLPLVLAALASWVVALHVAQGTKNLRTNAYGFVDTIVPAGPYSGGGTFRGLWSGPVPPDTPTSRGVPYP